MFTIWKRKIRVFWPEERYKGMNIKKIIALAALGTMVATAPVKAGGMAEPVMEPEVIAEETAASGGFVLPLILIALLVVAASSSGGGAS